MMQPMNIIYVHSVLVHTHVGKCHTSLKSLTINFWSKPCLIIQNIWGLFR